MEKSDTKKKIKIEKRQRKLVKKREKSVSVKSHNQYIEGVMPVVSCNSEIEYFYLEDGSILDMFGIITKDLNSAAEDELVLDKYLWEKLYKIYADDLKIIGLYFHPNTSEQQEYMSELLQRTESPQLKKLIKDKRDELAFVASEDVYMEMQFYLLYFAKNKTDYRQKSINIYSLLNQGLLPSIERVEFSRKEQIIYQLFNKNMRGERS